VNALSGYRTKGQLIYEQLKEGILKGNPAPGERLVMDQLAAELGVSKVPVREAVDRLIGEGWLARAPHVGPFVPKLEPGEVHETAVIRAALEAAAIRHAVPLHDARTLADVGAIMEKMESGEEDYAALNVQLHAALMAPCPYKQLSAMACGQLEKASRFHTVLRVRDYVNKTQAEHQAIVDAVRAGNAELAGSLTEDHILGAAGKLEEHLAETEH
jgi:DNA-binding GntR family transcriptional regulator